MVRINNHPNNNIIIVIAPLFSNKKQKTKSLGDNEKHQLFTFLPKKERYNIYRKMRRWRDETQKRKP